MFAPMANQPISVATAGAYPSDEPMEEEEPIAPLNTDEMLSQPADEPDPASDDPEEPATDPDEMTEDLAGLCDVDPALRYALLFDAANSGSPEALALAMHLEALSVLPSVETGE